VQLLTVQTMLMFLLAVFYDLQSPSDDNSCGLLKIQSTCLARKTAFDQTQSYCKWSSVTNVCTFNQPKFSALVIVYIAALVSAFTAVLNYPIDFMFEMLRAPTADTVKLKAADTFMKTATRRVSAAGMRVSEAAAASAAAIMTSRSRTKGKSPKQSIGAAGLMSRNIPAPTILAHQLANSSLLTVIECSEQLSLVQSKARQSLKFQEIGISNNEAHLEEVTLSADTNSVPAASSNELFATDSP
jgi:hypothetical protein